MTTTYLNPVVSDAGSGSQVAARARHAALVGLFLIVAALEFSIAVAQIFLAFTLLAWVVSLALERRRPGAPSWALPLTLFAGWTLLAASLSADPTTSLVDSKQLVLFVLVPLAYDLVDESSAIPLTTVVLAAGALSALVGIGQYAILHYDNLGQRPRGTLGLYMTFSGLMMLVLNVAIARFLFMTRSRIWPLMVIPALAVVLPLTFTRNTLAGSLIGVAVLLVMRNFRLTALLPVVAAVFLTVAPAPVVQRIYSIFDLHDPTNHDRVAMMHAGTKIIRDHPLTGVGPNMVLRVYPTYRDPDVVLQDAPHLHNVPLQIAAERGLPALGLWLWFIGAVAVGAFRRFRTAPREGTGRFLAAAALASIAAMLGAGMFEYNFGDSEFLMLFLVLITLPFAVTKKRF